jgi:hypothetical protein
MKDVDDDVQREKIRCKPASKPATPSTLPHDSGNRAFLSLLWRASLFGTFFCEYTQQIEYLFAQTTFTTQENSQQG